MQWRVQEVRPNRRVNISLREWDSLWEYGPDCWRPYRRSAESVHTASFHCNVRYCVQASSGHCGPGSCSSKWILLSACRILTLSDNQVLAGVLAAITFPDRTWQESVTYVLEFYCSLTICLHRPQLHGNISGSASEKAFNSISAWFLWSNKSANVK